MQAAKLMAAAAVVLAAGCATGGGSGDAAQSQCAYFAREHGLEWVRTVSSEPAAGGGTAVSMQLKDALGRPFNATCVYADGSKRWASELPANALSRQQGRDTVAAPPR